MPPSFFGNSEIDTELRVFASLDEVTQLTRVPQQELEERVTHLITGEIIRPDGVLIFPDDVEFKCLRNRKFAIEIKPDQVICDHLKVISELTEQARSYIDSRYDIPEWMTGHEVDGCVIYPDLETILSSMVPNKKNAKFPRNDDYKKGVIDMHRRTMARQRIFELTLNEFGFEILCCDERLCRWEASMFQVSGKNHKFQRKVGSKYS